MLQIGNVLASLDIVQRFFLLQPRQMPRECCIEGDAGAPITTEEYDKLKEILPIVWDDLLPAAQAVVEQQGVGYVDSEGDLVTSIVDGRNCVFTCYGPNGLCQCAIEKAFREGKTDFKSPCRATCTLPVLPTIRHFPPSTTTVGKYAKRPKH